MRTKLVVLTVLSALLALLVVRLSAGKVYALFGRNVEFVFMIVDADSGIPVPGAIVSIRDDLPREPGVELRFERRESDPGGKVTFLRKDLMSEDIIRPLARTRTTFDTVWAVLSVSKEGYRSVRHLWLASEKYEYQGVVGEIDGKKTHRIMFRIPIRKEPDE